MKTIMDYLRAFSIEKDSRHETEEVPVASTGQGGVSKEVPADKEEKKLCNQVILDEILKIFSSEIKFASVDEVVVFPMTFTIGMSQRDFTKFHSYMPLITDLAISNFYRIIKEEMGDSRTCYNVANYWSLSFIPCISGVTEIDENTLDIPEGKVMVFATPTETVTDIADTEGGINVSLTVNGSEIFGNVNINRSILASFKTDNVNGKFQRNWDRNMFRESRYLKIGTDTNHREPEVQPGPAGGVLAQLSCTYKDEYVSYDMHRNVCTISGSSDSRTDATIFKLPCQMVKPGHIVIEYIEKSDKFMLAAYGKTIMNGSEIKQSVGGDVNWVELPDRAGLNLNGVLMVKFKKNV